jgi:trk system potassium uptake protein TrkH
MTGQFFILLLIQLGGLGIMTITTVALHAMGRRLSLKQERILTSMTDTDHRDLVKSLAIILKFTFISEATGAVLLTLLFYFTGDTPGESVWRGIFTAISAFCNAGFALQSDSLIPYQANPFILHVVGTLIIFGGLAPATSLIVPRWLSGKQIPIQARLALQTTAILLVAGAFFLLVSEWNGVLARLSFDDKIHNAWFQSVTLRTAGFNSIDIASVASPSFLIMLLLMFIGGSPGGTAGGIKTTTVSILAMTFWANITNRNDISACNRRIRSTTIYRAITIVVAGMIVWFIVVLMLVTTQAIPARDLIFEATSALGTVGLSTGATPLLDEIGKIVVIIAMFVGRIGPMTLFMLLSSEYAATASRYPDAKISIT